MKLEVGMYVRYVSGFHHNKTEKPIVLIGKILRADDYINLDTFFGGVVYPEKEFEIFIKGEPSHNIIDLIEVGDFVNGLKVYGITDYGLQVYMFGDCPEILKENEIETIVTKEQFESMSYKVGD